MAKKIMELTTVTTPLTGAELLEMSQSDVSTKCTTAKLKSFINLTDLLRLQETGEPSEPPDGEGFIFMSNGGGGFNAGDIIAASTYDDGEGAVTTYTIIHDFSSGTSWPGGE